MRAFRQYVQEGKVKSGSKDPAQARSLFEQSTLRLNDVKSLSFTDQNASFRFEDIYESLREALQAFMALEGYKPYSHEAVIAYAFEKKLFTEFESATFDRYRKIRHDITYRGEKTTSDETKEALIFVEGVHSKLKIFFAKKFDKRVTLIDQLKEENISLVAASKGRSVSQIKELYDLGIKTFGENYVQEAEDKINKLQDLDIEWHFIGHLQKNKSKKAAALFHSIDTVDSVELAQSLDNAYNSLHKKGNILIQVNISRQESKSGIFPEKLDILLEQISKLKNVKINGLLSMGSKENNLQEFKEMKRLFERYKEKYNLGELSMGMSNDYGLAVENGATQVRLGRVLFE